MCLKKALLFLWCILSLTLADGQSQADSLKSVMSSKKSYQQKINAYLLYLEKFGLQDFDEMLRLGNEGLELAIKNDDPVSVAELKRSIGEALYFKGNYDLATQNFFDAIIILEKTKESKKLATVYNALAKLYRKTRDLDRAAQTYDKALRIYSDRNDSSGIATIMNESGVVFEYAGQYDKAIERYTTSLKINERLRDQRGISYALSNLAGVYTLQKKYAEAENYLLGALRIRKQLNDTFAIALNFSDLGATYYAHKNFAKAKLYVDSSNALADKMNYPELKQTNYALLADVAQNLGDYQKALTYVKMRALIRDSLFSFEKTKQIEELNTRYETVKKEQKIREQQYEITIQNTIIICAVVLLSLVVLLAMVHGKRIKWKQEARMHSELVKQQELATTAILQAEENERQRIAKDLHDGIGQMMSAAKMNLSAYESKAEHQTSEQKQAFEKIIQLVDESCREVRAVSHNMMPNALVKNNLAAAIREFINKLDQKKMKVHFYAEGLDERLNPNVETVLYRVIQECVNNVMKHSDADILDISVVKDQQEITATIEDNGRGFDVNDLTGADGIGLKNIRTRVEFLKGTVDVDSAPGKGTVVALHVPLN